MDIALLVARLLLAAVFALAAFGKITDPKGTREALAGFGVPRFLITPFGILLPVAELAVAVLLIPTATAAYGAIGALVLLGLFIIGIAVSMARGQAPDCHCFGQLHSEPAGWSTLIRNFILAGVAAFVAVAGWDDAGTSAVSWIGDLSGFEQVALVVGVVMAVAIAVEGWLLLHALGQNGRLLFRLEAVEGIVLGGEGVEDMDEDEEEAAAPARGLPLGTPAPAFALSGIFGEVLTLDALRSQGKPVMLIFSDPNCGPCNAMLPDIAGWQRDHFATMTAALISRGSVEANREKIGKNGLANVLLQQDREVAESFNAPATPSAVLVSPDGDIASALAEGAQAIRLLVSRTTAGSATPSANGGPARAEVPVAARTPAVPAARGACPSDGPESARGSRARS
jgi:peroxiredoxin